MSIGKLFDKRAENRVPNGQVFTRKIPVFLLGVPNGQVSDSRIPVFLLGGFFTPVDEQLRIAFLLSESCLTRIRLSETSMFFNA